MDDFLEQVARRRHQGAYTFLYFVMWVFIVIFGLIGVTSLFNIIGMTETGGIKFNFIDLIFGVVFGGSAFLLWRRADYCRMEYDYTFTNGTLDVGQVLNNKRRRYLTAMDLKDVTSCGPLDTQAFKKALAERDVKRHNWFLNRDANLYFFCFTKNNVKHLAILELQQEMVNLIRGKGYLPRGAWATEDGKSGYGISAPQRLSDGEK